MSDNYMKVNKGLYVNPQSSAPTNPQNGFLYYDQGLNEMRAYINGSWISVGASNPTPTGMSAPYWFSTAPAGWCLMGGRTIGNSLSGATERADDDTENLFTGLWNSIANAQLPIQDSNGILSSRGVSAAADFAANKRLPLPDLRGRTLAGKNDMPSDPIQQAVVTARNAAVTLNTADDPGAPNTQYYGNTFLASANGTLKSISLALTKNISSPMTGEIRLRLYNINGSGNSTGGILATSDSFDLSTFPPPTSLASAPYYTFNFPTTPSLTNGVRYGWVLYTDAGSTGPGGNSIVIVSDNTNQSPENRLYTTDGGISFLNAGSSTRAEQIVSIEAPVNRLTIPFNGNILANAGGLQTHNLTSGEMPSHTHIQDSHTHIQDAHTHTQNAHSHTIASRTGWANVGTIGTNNADGTVGTSNTNSTTATNQNTTATNQNTTATNQNTGGDQAHNNVQPTMVANWIIKL